MIKGKILFRIKKLKKLDLIIYVLKRKIMIKGKILFRIKN